MKKTLTGLSALLLSLPAFAATPINLSHQDASILMNRTLTSSGIQFDEISRSIDFNKTLHIRVQEKYKNYSVYGADAVVHIPNANGSIHSLASAVTPKTSMNGIVYQDLNQDLANTQAFVFDKAHMEKAISHVISLYQQKNHRNVEIKEQTSELMVYLDNNHKAHWAYHISFFVPSALNQHAQKPAYIVDAVNFDLYQTWNDLKTLDDVSAGGLGGNHKTGKKIFDGTEGNFPVLAVQRDANQGICYMQNKDFTLHDYRSRGKVMKFDCKATDSQHNNVYWNGNHDAVRTTWSPSNDALYGAQVTKDMFTAWYNMPMLVKDGKPMLLPVTVHDPDENAYWDGKQVTFGDSEGSTIFNPFTQLDTVAHEIAHGFTEQHSDLYYYGQSGGLNEAFSDMAGIAAEYFAYGKTDFLVGLGDVMAEGKALRYMEKPSKDCEDKIGYQCSIDDMSQYTSDLDVHYSSGIFNRVYYLLAHTPGWDARKAFDVMVQANMNYWTSRTSFADAACGVMKATADYHYDVAATANAFQIVGIDTKTC